MTLKVDVQHTGDVAVVNCAGRIIRGEASCGLRTAVMSQRDARIVVLDLSDVETVDGGGLGMLVFLQRWATKHRVQLKLVNPSHLVRELLERTQLTRIFDISSVEDALAILGCEHHMRRQFDYALAS